MAFNERSQAIAPSSRIGRATILSPGRGFRRRFGAAMAAAGLTLDSLVKVTGVNGSSIESWLAGRARPRADNLERVAAALGVSSTQLLTGDSPSPAPPAPASEAPPPALVSAELDGLLREIVSRLGVHIADVLLPAITEKLAQQNAGKPLPDVMNMSECAALIGRSRHTVREFTRLGWTSLGRHRRIPDSQADTQDGG